MKKLHTPLPTVTIGIPAYNEEANIKFVLQDLLSQSQNGFRIKKIIVASDGSTDSTIAQANSLKNPLVKVVAGPRVGKAKRLEQIFKLSSSEATVILDADTRIQDKEFLGSLIRPIIQKEADLTSSSQAETKPQSLVERVLYCSMQVLNAAYAEYRNGNNFFTCHGQSRAFSTRLAKALQLPFSSGEDLYSYLFCLSRGFVYRYVPNAVTHYRLPTNLADHFSQSSRFIQATEKIKENFPKTLTDRELSLPVFHIAKYALQSLIRYPLYMGLYILIFAASRIKARIGNHFQDGWIMSLSSKKSIKV